MAKKDKVGLGKDGYQKGGSIMGGAGKGAMQGAQLGNAIVPGMGAVVGGAIGAIGGAFKGGQVSDADKAAYYARQEAERIQANPMQVAGMDAATQRKNIEATMTSASPEDYAAAMPGGQATARQMQGDIQQAGQAAVGAQSQMVAQAQQAQRDQVLNLLNYAADTERAETQQENVQAQTRMRNQAANQQFAANTQQLGEDLKSIFNPTPTTPPK
jgi:hypothetical protein